MSGCRVGLGKNLMMVSVQTGLCWGICRALGPAAQVGVAALPAAPAPNALCPSAWLGFLP